MKLLFVLENYHPHVGGVEFLFKTLCEKLAKKHDVTVITRLLPGTKKREAVGGVRILRVPSMNSRYVFSFAAIPEVIKQAKKADVIHTTTYNAAFPASYAAKKTKTPAIITVHETWIDNWEEYSDFKTIGAKLHDVLERLLYKWTTFTKYVCVSNSTNKMLTKALPELKKRITTIHNGFDPTLWSADHKKEADKIKDDLALHDKYVLVAAGRPGTSKGFQYLLDSFPLIKKKIDNAVLLLILSTDKQYAHRIKKWKKQAHNDIFFIKPQPYKDLPPFRHLADCNIIPSLAEGFGFTVLECAATGKPFIATNTTSIPEVAYGKHILIEPKSPEAIADGVFAILKKKYKNTPAKSFPWDTTVQQYEQLYEGLL